MKAKGVNGTELAKRLNMSPTSVVPFTSLNREWNPTFSTLLKLADALEISILELVAGKENELISAKDLHKEFESLKESISPLSNLPCDVIGALKLVKKDIQIQILREVLKGFGLVEHSHPTQ